MLRTTAFVLAFAVAAFSAFQFPWSVQIEPVPHLNVTQYLGRWYQMAAGPLQAYTFELNGVCILADYGLFPNNTISVHNMQRQNSPTGPVKDIRGYAFAPNASEPAKLEVHLGGVPVGAPYWIVGLGPANPDNDNKYEYAIVSDGLQLSLFVLARDVDRFNEKYQKKVSEQLEAMGFNKFYNKPIPTTQKGCTYPPPEPQAA